MRETDIIEKISGLNSISLNLRNDPWKMPNPKVVGHGEIKDFHFWHVAIREIHVDWRYMIYKHFSKLDASL
jgi:hypothetical protein